MTCKKTIFWQVLSRNECKFNLGTINAINTDGIWTPPVYKSQSIAIQTNSASSSNRGMTLAINCCYTTE